MKTASPVRPLAVLAKGMLFFLLVNFFLAVVPHDGLGRISLYNRVFPGRERLPFGENPAASYNLSLFNLDAMLASHVIAGPPGSGEEFRVILIGDSSVWGTLLQPEETLAGRLNAIGLAVCGQPARVYNLGYPTISLTKDLLVLDAALAHEPDLVIWLVTLEAFPADKQLSSPIVANNAARLDDLAARLDLDFDSADPALVRPDLWDRTLIGQRRSLADLFRLQMYGAMWAATGIDQIYPSDYPAPQIDFDPDVSFHGMQPPDLAESALAFDTLEAGLRLAGETPVLLINEPMLVSSGENSDLRYNFFYPRWAYDAYRQIMSARAERNGWAYLDLWDLILDPAYYTNSAIHLTPDGEAILANHLAEVIRQQGCP
ncbi:MAG: SGNH/GDSL hydrolase family protein [Anaerolineales bacterium]|nr:SGNH/GDSL hydrolase family protein [Anaerolineales bacterium]